MSRPLSFFCLAAATGVLVFLLLRPAPEAPAPSLDDDDALFSLSLEHHAERADAPGEEAPLSGTPHTVPRATDCMLRGLAMDFATRALGAPLPALKDALQLAKCSSAKAEVEVEEEDPWRPPSAPLTHDIPRNGLGGGWAGESLLILWVDPVKGSDWTFQAGSQAFPLRTVHEAVRRAGKAKATKTQIILRGGTYAIPEGKPITLTKPLQNVDIRNAPGERAVLSGGEAVSIPLHAWKRVSKSKTLNMAVWVTQLPDSTAPFQGLRVSSLAQRLVRAKTPNGAPEQSGAAFHFSGDQAFGAGGRYREGWFPKSPSIPVKWIAWTPSTLAATRSEEVDGKSWPGVTWPEFPSVSNAEKQSIFVPRPGMGAQGPFTTGVASSSSFSSSTSSSSSGGERDGASPCSQYVPPSGYFCNPNVPRGSQFHTRSPIGMHVGKEHDLPEFEPGVVVTAWRGGEGGWGATNPRWNSWTWEVRDVQGDTVHFQRGGGVQGSQGSDEAAEWYVENSLKYLDEAGEWYFDPQEKKLYVAFNGTNGGPLGSETWTLVRTKELVRVMGASHVTLSGLVVRDAALTWLEPHGMPSAGDWALPRMAAVVAEDVDDFVIRDCLFERVDGNGVLIHGRARGVVLERNTFAWMGATGVVLWGKTSPCLDTSCKRKLPGGGEGPDGRGGTQPRGTIIRGNVFRELGVFVKQSAAVFQALAGQSVVENNVMFNGPRSLLNFNDGFLGGDVVRGNLFANAVRESTDHGPVNLWDRVPYIHEGSSSGSGGTVIPKERVFERNFFLDTYNVQSGIDADDAASYIRTTRNVFVYGFLGLKSDFGGHNHVSTGDMYVHVTGSCFIPPPVLVPQSVNLGLVFRNNTCLLSSTNKASPATAGGLGYASRCHHKKKQDHQVVVGFNRVSARVPLRSSCGGGEDLASYLKKHEGTVLDPGTTVVRFPGDEELRKWVHEVLW